MKKRPGGAAVLLQERFPKIVPQWRCEVEKHGGGEFRVETLETVRILEFLELFYRFF